MKYIVIRSVQVLQINANKQSEKKVQVKQKITTSLSFSCVLCSQSFATKTGVVFFFFVYVVRCEQTVQ